MYKNMSLGVYLRSLRLEGGGNVTEKPLYCLIVSFYVLPVLAMPLSLCVLCVDGHVVT